MNDYSVFQDIAARDSQLPSPRPGQACTTLDTGALLVYYGTTIGWRPPWNTAWGEVGRSELTATFTQFVNVNNIEAPMPDVTFTPCVGRRYEIRWRMTVETAGSGQAGDVGVALIASIGTVAPATFAGLAGQFILDGYVLRQTDIPTFYLFRWRRLVLVSRDITPLVTAGIPMTWTPQYAYGGSIPDSYVFSSTTDGLYGNGDPGSESSFTVHDVGPWANLSDVA